MAARKSRGRRNGNSIGYFMLFAVLALGIVLVLEYLDYRRGRPTFILSRVMASRTKTDGTVRPARRKGDFHRQLVKLMDSRDSHYSMIQDSRGRYHVKWKLEDSRRRKLVSELEKLSREYEQRWKAEEIQHLRGEHLYLYSISPAGSDATHLLLITTGTPEPLPEPPPSEQEPRGRLAIIIDDIGFNELGSMELKSLGIPVTAAVIPHAPYAYDEARQLNMYGIEQIIHLPMQSTNRELKADPSRFIIKGADLSSIRRLVQRSRTLVPYARGVNNHMGSLITGDRQTMGRVLSVLREEGLFFVDSRTTSSTVAYRMARDMKVPVTQRDAFLEDIQNDNVTFNYTRKQVLKVAELARRKGHAVAIGHPYPTTIKAIRAAVGEVRAMGVRFVPVSRLLEN